MEGAQWGVVRSTTALGEDLTSIPNRHATA